MCLMTRWQLCRLLIQVIFKRDFLAAARTLLSVLFSAHETVTTVAEPEAQPQAKPRFEYDPISSRMVKRSLAGLLVLASASSVWALGSVDVMDPITKLGKRLTGGDGITISGSTISASGTATAFANYTSAEGGRVTVDVFANHTSSLGTAAYTESSDYATSAQGAKADTALQPGSTGRGSITVCAAGTVNTSACNYICDGVNDEVQIQAAVDSLPDVGGDVDLSEGYFGIGGDINIAKANVEVVGKGQSTVLYPTAAGVKIFVVSSGTTARTYAKQFRNLKFITLAATSPAVTGNGSTVTVTTGAAHGYTTGNSIWMRGWSGGSGTWNGVYAVTVTDSTHFTYAATGNGTATGGKVGYAATAIYSYRSSQQKLIDVTISDFSRAIYAEEPWDHFQTSTQIMDCGAGDDYQTAAVVLRNGAVGGDKVAGYFIDNGRHETWMVGMGTQFLFDGSNSGGLSNDNIRISNSKFEYYIANPVIKGINTQHVQLNGNNFNGCTSNVIDADNTSGQWNIGGPTNFICGDSSGRSQPIVSQIKFAGSVMNVTGAYFRVNGASQSSFEISGNYLNASGNVFSNNNGDPARFHFTAASANNRVFANHASWASGTVNWSLDDGGTSNIVWGNGNGDNVTESLFNFTDVATANVSTTKHGLTPKLPNDTSKFLDGTGNYSVPTGLGSVTSVGLSLPSELSITGSPVTTAGTLLGTWADQTTGKAFMSPNGSTGTPSFRALAAPDFGTTMAPQFGTIGVNAANDGTSKIYSWGSTAIGVYGNSGTGGTGVKGATTTGTGVYGVSNSSGDGVFGSSDSGRGFYASSVSGKGIYAASSTGAGIAGEFSGGFGTGIKIYQYKTSAAMTQSNDNPTAYIQKNMDITGGSYTATGPALLVENAIATADSDYGPLIQAKKGSTIVFQINEDGAATHSGNLTVSGTINNPASAVDSDATVDTAATPVAIFTSSTTTTLTASNVVAGRCFSVIITSTSGGAISFAGFTPTWIDGTAPGSITATKKTMLTCMGTGANTADCIDKENY